MQFGLKILLKIILLFLSRTSITHSAYTLCMFLSVNLQMYVYNSLNVMYHNAAQARRSIKDSVNCFPTLSRDKL